MAHLFTLDDFRSYAETLDRRASSAAVIIANETRALIIKANYKSHWTFPGGVVDARETPKQAAIREVEEEIGLKLDPAKLAFGWVANRSSRVAVTYQFIFRYPLEESMISSIKLQVDEIEDWRIVTRDEVLSNNLHYSKAAELWARAEDISYVEQAFGS